MVLSSLVDNLASAGDPMGLSEDYWSGWSQGLDLPNQGEELLFTSRMYQMLPYLAAATGLLEQSQPLLRRSVMARLAGTGRHLVGPVLLRRRAGEHKDLAQRGQRALVGITTALTVAGHSPAYLHQDEPYSGALLHDLGLETGLEGQAKEVSRRLNGAGAKRVIAGDPHTAHLLKDAYPDLVSGWDLEVSHYLEILAGAVERIREAARPAPVKTVVVHDSCVLARSLGLVEPLRVVLSALGVEVKEPSEAREDTGCCGGPVEYAFPELSRRLSGERARALAAHGQQVLVACPVCLVNLARHEEALGIRVWDLGELLYHSLGAGEQG